MGFDQLSNEYNFYRVLGSKCTVTFQMQAGQNYNDLVFPFLVPTLAATPTTIAAGDMRFLEQAYSKYSSQPLTPIGYVGSNRRSLKSSMSTEKIWGQTPWSSDNFSAGTAASPQNKWYWATGVVGTAASTSSLNLNMFIVLEFYACFSGRVFLDRS